MRRNLSPTLKLSRARIEGMDLERIVQKLCRKRLTIQDRALSRKQAQEAIIQYKRFLWVLRKYRRQYRFLPPSREIDYVWHAHILDTRSYQRDCRLIFGRFIHHDPYFGLNGRNDEQSLRRSFHLTQKLYEREHGEPIYAIFDL